MPAPKSEYVAYQPVLWRNARDLLRDLERESVCYGERALMGVPVRYWSAVDLDDPDMGAAFASAKRRWEWSTQYYPQTTLKEDWELEYDPNVELS